MKNWPGYEHGINFGGWLSQCRHTEAHYDSFIGADDFKKVASWGLDHIRIPVDYDLFLAADGTFLTDRFRYIDFAIAQCRINGLNMILDLHRTPGFSFDPGVKENGLFELPECQETFYRIWEELAKRYGKDTDCVAFELLNEVTAKEYSESWNRVADTCIKKIRAIAPDTDILVGGYWNNSVEAVRDLGMPQDEHIVYNFHCYEPLLFTHQGATWTEKIDPAKRMAYEESETSEQYFEDLIADAVAAAEKYHVPLYCGEYGVIDRVGGEDTLKWYRCIHSVLERHHIGRCAWTYRELDFGLTDARLDSVRGEILQCL